MRPIDTMPKKGRILVDWDGVCCIAHAQEDGVLIEGYAYSRPPNVFRGWSPIPDANSRVVTREELEELIAACVGEVEAKFAGEWTTGHEEDRIAARKAVGLE